MELDPKYWVVLVAVLATIAGVLTAVYFHVSSSLAIVGALVFAFLLRYVVNFVGRMVYGSNQWVRL